MPFSTVDLANAFYQVALHEDNRDLTDFITHEGLFCYKRVCYGLASALAAFQKLISAILKDVLGVQCYLDDIIVEIFGSQKEALACVWTTDRWRMYL